MWDFELVDIKKSQAPVNDEGGSWYHYTIANRISTVNGCRRGSRDEVKAFVSSTIKRLNARHLGMARKQSITL